MKLIKLFTAGATLAAIFCAQAVAAPPECKPVIGKFTEVVIPVPVAPLDPFGRVVLHTEGTLTSIGTAILLSVGPGPQEGTLGATTKHLFLVSKDDQLVADGTAIFYPTPGSLNVKDVLTLQINPAESTGKFAGATGTIVATGIGYNFFAIGPDGPYPSPTAANKAYFEFTLKGQICVAK